MKKFRVSNTTSIEFGTDVLYGKSLFIMDMRLMSYDNTKGILAVITELTGFVINKIGITQEEILSIPSLGIDEARTLIASKVNNYINNLPQLNQ